MSTTKSTSPQSQGAPSAPGAAPAKSGGGINLGRRLMTAGILIPIVLSCARFPQSWFLLNLGFPALVMMEYSTIMAKILEYVNSLSQGPAQFVKEGENESVQQRLMNEMISKLNVNWFTVLWLFLIHVSYMTFQTSYTVFFIAIVFMAMIASKLFIYCRFMDSQHSRKEKQESAVMKDDSFIRHAMIVTCVSVLLEIFGHLYISTCTGLGYMFYCLDPRYICMSFCISWQADNGGLLFGSLMGKRPFAHGISPKKTQEGIIGAFILCFLSVVLIIWPISHYVTDFLWPAIPFWDIVIISQLNALLAVFSDLLESFMKRCAGVKDSSSILPGHGGFFDRIDSLLLPIIPMLFYMMTFRAETLPNKGMLVHSAIDMLLGRV